MAHHETHSHGSEVHAHSTGPYYVVYVLLMILLAVTVWVAYVHLGWLNIPVAMGIATVKAAMVVLYFMHVKDSSPLVGLSVIAGIVFLGIGFALILSDYLFR